jgi:methyl-accepting chemotaxis protein
MRTSVGSKLLCTYLLIIAITVAPAAAVCYYLRDVRQSQVELLQGSQPTLAAARGVREGLHQAASGIRGSLAAGDEQFRTQRELGQQEMRRNMESLHRLSRHLTAEERQLLDQVRHELGDIEALHQAMATAPRPTAEAPAFQKLAGDSTPLGEQMLAMATAIIESESKLEKTPQRVKLLDDMTSLRAALHGSLVEMHSYLTTAQEQHIGKFNDQWRSVSAGLAALAAKRRMLTPDQNRQLGQIQQLVGQFQPMPDRLFAMRKTQSWNVAQRPVRDDAAPREARAEALLAQVISGAENRAQQGTRALQAQSAWLGVFAVGGPGAAAVIGILLGCMATRRVSRRLRRTAKALEAVAAGDLTARLPIETSDEFGRMASAINTLAETSTQHSQAPEMLVDLGRLRSFVHAEVSRRRPHTRAAATPISAVERVIAQDEAVARPAARASAMDANLSQTLRTFQATLSQVMATAGQLASGTRQVTASSQRIASGNASSIAADQLGASQPEQLAGIEGGATLRPELAQRTEMLEQSSERLRSQATQLDELMRRLQAGLAQMPVAEAETISSDKVTQTSIHGAERQLVGPKTVANVVPQVLQTT